ncbi:hypothetical protein GGI23_007314, partial [Coemansia sp. RSA 2559]
SQNTRIPVRRTVAAINDENKVGGAPATAAAAHAGKINEPVKPMAASKFRPGATVGAAPARTTAIPVKAFGASISSGVPAQRPRAAALSNMPNVKLVKPGEVAGRIPANRLIGRAGRVVPLSGIAKPLATSGVTRPIATAVPPAASARPTANAPTGAVLTQALRPISKPVAVFGAGRRARPLSSGGSQNTFSAAASSFKRARTVDSSAASGSSSVLGKHTRSGRTPPLPATVAAEEEEEAPARSMSHVPLSKAAPVQVGVAAASVPVSRVAASKEFALMGLGIGGASQSDDSGATAVNSETSSSLSRRDSTQSTNAVLSSPVADMLGEMKM